jgi:GT2 family glycosyltransferase
MHQGSLITVAVPTLLGGNLLASCLDSLNSQTFRDFEVVVINNGRAELTPPPASYTFPWRILSPGSNVGFGAAVNLAIRASSSPYVAILNDDTEPAANWLLSLASELDGDPRVGMWASRIQLRGSSALDSAGMVICFDGSSKQRGHCQPASSFCHSQDVLFPSGCAALYRRIMLDEIGLFDEDYFLYCEDTDLGLRARWAGWTCRYVSEAVVEHRYSGTSGAYSAMKAGFVERNRLWVALKNFPGVLLPGVPFVAVSRYFWQLRASRGSTGAAAEFIRSGNSLFAAAAILLRAHRDTFLRLPSLLKKRAQARKMRRIGSAEFIRLMYRHRIAARQLANA